MEPTNRSLLHSILKRKRKDSKWKGLDRFAVEQLIRMLAFGFPLAVLALLGNAKLEEFRTKQREFDRRQQVWSTLHNQLSETYGTFRHALTDSRVLYIEYLDFSEELDMARHNGSSDDELDAMFVERDFKGRASALNATLISSLEIFYNITHTSLLYSVAHDRIYIDDYVMLFMSSSLLSASAYTQMLACISNDLLADATIYYEQSLSDNSLSMHYGMLSVLMLDHNLKPTDEEYEVAKMRAKDAKTSLKDIAPELQNKAP